jgi:Fur family transcriptional regulator, ferric uptake regulator
MIFNKTLTGCRRDGMKKEVELLGSFIRRKGLRYTPQREEILKAFLSQERHLSADELYRLVHRKNRSIGCVSVYRTMKLLEEAGLCDEVDLGDGKTRFEHKFRHQHHDHLVCVKCGRCIEVADAEIEKLQDELAKRKGFVPLKHKLQIFGVCAGCARRYGKDN